ncbi:hypothetical protein GQX74_013650 [Glossina fuscipes]|nr:hypothetical protein GQX74_013650 [Glossina fuscipes]
MITDVQLAIFSNFLGVFLFLLVVLYHYINANSNANFRHLILKSDIINELLNLISVREKAKFKLPKV